jgi:hypothetical protein
MGVDPATVPEGAVTDILSREQSVDTHQKALRINLDPRWYGTVAEIGAGQEVARWFFRVGAAAGTIAKTISAYDMAVSDAVYGEVDRYVSEARLQAMLDHEYALNIDRLGDRRGDNTSFFAFADTVVARSFRGGNECHGWMGVKFQAHPHDEPSQVVLHVRMLDVEAALQQEALGVVGVNLLHGAFFEHHEPEKLVESLLDRLSTDRIEIDLIRFRGIEFRSVDNRLVALQLVQLGLSGVAMFGPDKEVLQPSEILRKKAVLIERGSFRPTTMVNLDMLECALAKFEADPAVDGRPVLALAELTMRNLLAGGDQVDRRDFLARAELLGACGLTTMISDYFDYYRLAAFLSERTSGRIGIVMGVPSLIDLFDEQNHAQLQGGILESFGRLFKNDLKVYVYPLRRSEKDELETVDNLSVDLAVRPLYDYLARRGSFVPLDNYCESYLSIFSRDVLKRIGEGDESWEPMVPAGVAELIKKRGFFGCIRSSV